jgi:DNA invertase Pin-like site-specific DNA recombinase
MDRDDTEKGVGRQREDAEALAASRGYQIEDRYRFTDNDVSASNGDYRPGYAALMDAAARGELDVIIVWQLSRLWRNRRERAGGIDMLKRAGVPVAACKGMDLDLSTSYGRMMGDIMGAADTWESEVKGERVTAAQIQAAAAGRWTGGTRPFGWDLLTDPAAKGTKTEHRLVVPVLNEAEAAEVRRLATALLSGRSLGMLVKDLNDRGIRTTWGGRWTPASLRKVLTRSRNFGQVEFAGVVYPGVWPPIYGEDVHRKVVALLSDPERRTSTGNVTRYLLSGIATCGICGERVKSGSAKNRNGTRRKLYKCPKEHLFRSQEAVDSVVVPTLIMRLRRMTPQARAAALAGDSEPAPQALEASRLRAKLAEFADMLVHDEIDRAEYKRQRTILKGQITAAERQMARASRVPVLGEFLASTDIDKAWAALPLDRQRAVLGELLSVVILPGAHLGHGEPLNPQTVGLGIGWKLWPEDEDLGDVLARLEQAE